MRHHRTVAAHSYIEIGERLILACRESYVPELAALFAEPEVQDQGEAYGYLSRVDHLRDRLQLHGFTAQRAMQELTEAVRAWHESEPDPGEDIFDVGVPVLDAPGILAGLRHYVNSTDPLAEDLLPEGVRWRLDPRTVLRLALDLTDDTRSPVRYNLDELVSRGFLERGTLITNRSREERRARLARDAPLIVLTEGSSDSRLLKLAVSVTHPHLTEFLRFMDFSKGTKRSVGALADLVRSFIDAGIANRVVAIADNDTAAYDALRKLKCDAPESYRILHYPDLPLLVDYPTLGPQSDSPVRMNVNRKAGSLEMYLGKDLLTVNGELVPVQWTGYIEGQKSYQGAIFPRHKKRIQEEFELKVAAAIQDPAVQATHDWSGVTAIVETILTAFD